ncbi:MAG: MTAP family purine nucleoside phosphorylase [bacterium]
MIGVLGGTSFLETELVRMGTVERVMTPWGGCDVILAEPLCLIARHGREGYLPPHRINHHAHLAALKQLDVRGVVSVGSVGSLKPSLPPGSLVVIDDYYAPGKLVTYHHDRIRFTVPRYNQDWRSALLDQLRKNGLEPVDGGVYAETTGPRFETVAEIKALSIVADVVGMTCASETMLARELDLPHAVVVIVDNVAHGIGTEPLTEEGFRAQVRVNHELALRVLKAVKRM